MSTTLFTCPPLLSDGEKACFNADGTRIVVVRMAGRYLAFEARCPHRGMDLSQWGVMLPDSKIMCSSHGYVFDMESGENLITRGDAPRVGPLRTYEVVERDGELHVLRPEPAVAALNEAPSALAG